MRPRWTCRRVVRLRQGREHDLHRAHSDHERIDPAEEDDEADQRDRAEKDRPPEEYPIGFQFGGDDRDHMIGKQHDVGRKRYQQEIEHRAHPDRPDDRQDVIQPAVGAVPQKDAHRKGQHDRQKQEFHPDNPPPFRRQRRKAAEVDIGIHQDIHRGGDHDENDKGLRALHE
jgi:hypothetical protein